MFACLSTAGRDDVGCGAVVVVQVLAPLRLLHSAHNRHPSNWPRPGRPPLVPPTPVQAGAANSQLVPLLSLPTVNWSKILSLPTVNWALSLLPNKRFTLICHLATVDWGRANNIQRVRGCLWGQCQNPSHGYLLHQVKSHYGEFSYFIR